MMINTLVVFYSTYGHVHRMARAVEEGAAGVQSTEVRLRRIPELAEARNALSGVDAYQQAQEAQRHIPEATLDDLRCGRRASSRTSRRACSPAPRRSRADTRRRS